MILPIFLPVLPILLGVAGAMMVAAGILVIAHHRHRALVPIGVLAVLAGVTIAAPLTVAETARTAIEATSGTVTGLLERSGTAAPEMVAIETEGTP
jgi:hypothetical protein